MRLAGYCICLLCSPLVSGLASYFLFMALMNRLSCFTWRHSDVRWLLLYRTEQYVPLSLKVKSGSSEFVERAEGICIKTCASICSSELAGFSDVDVIPAFLTAMVSRDSFFPCSIWRYVARIRSTDLPSQLFSDVRLVGSIAIKLGRRGLRA